MFRLLGKSLFLISWLRLFIVLMSVQVCLLVIFVIMSLIRLILKLRSLFFVIFSLMFHQLLILLCLKVWMMISLLSLLVRLESLLLIIVSVSIVLRLRMLRKRRLFMKYKRGLFSLPRTLPWLLNNIYNSSYLERDCEQSLSVLLTWLFYPNLNLYEINKSLGFLSSSS